MLFDFHSIIKPENIKKGLELKSIKCPICSSNEWKLVGETQEKVRYYEKAGENTHIYVKVICENCGFVAEFDALKIAYREEEDI